MLGVQGNSPTPKEPARIRHLLDVDTKLQDAVLLLRRNRNRLRNSESTVTGFLCDSGLGGLARWLRACGFEARWDPCLDDTIAIREAQHTGLILLTTDGPLLERRVVTCGQVQVFWIHWLN
jgi:hypothetical protein